MGGMSVGRLQVTGRECNVWPCFSSDGMAAHNARCHVVAKALNKKEPRTLKFEQKEGGKTQEERDLRSSKKKGGARIAPPRTLPYHTVL
jgi:hypothetical protein